VGKDKHKRFAENATFPNLIQPTFEEVFNRDYSLKGKWSSDIFQNNNSIILELGCGKCEYTVELAKKYPGNNFIGVDVKGARIWRGAKDCLEQHVPNARFLRTRIEFIRSFFSTDEITEIWITFPDPQMQKSRRNKRLTSSRFLEAYSKFLINKGIIHLKTDNTVLFNYTLDIIKKNNLSLIIQTDNLYESPHSGLTHGVKTFYEKMYLAEGIPICYVQFDLNNSNTFSEPDEE
jgi:tRNA (guanine-N7-)-methyltransferase